MANKTFKEYAKEARRRLKSGFWTNLQKEKDDAIALAQKNGQPVEMVQAKFKRIIECEINASNRAKEIIEDEAFYKKVCEILDSNKCTVSPLAKLIDHEVYDELCGREKEMYILKLSERYVKMKERYENEHKYNVDVAN